MRLHAWLTALLTASGCAAAQPPAIVLEKPAHWAWWAGGQGPFFDEALTLAGLDRQTFSFRPEVVGLWGGDRWRLPVFDLFFASPWHASPYGREQAVAAARAAPKFHDLFVHGQTAAGIRVRDNHYGTFLKEYTAAVEAGGPLALARALEALGAGNAGDIAQQPGYQNLPPRAAAAAAMILHSAKDAAEFRRIALIEPLGKAGINPAEARRLVWNGLFWNEGDDAGTNPEGNAKFASVRDMLTLERIAGTVDFPLLCRGVNLLALAVDDAVRRLHEAPPGGTYTGTFRMATPAGTVCIAGTGSDTHGAEAGHDLLTLDLGGDDRWLRGGASGPGVAEGISVIVDVSGNDHYEQPAATAWCERLEKGPRGGQPGFHQEKPDEHAPAFGAGISGYGLLADLAGDDRFTVPFGGLGCGLLGCGAMLDLSGNDTSRGDTGILGCAVLGTGTAADLGGSDTCTVLHKSLGYGGLRGTGIAVNTGGDDRYTADTEHVKYSWFDDFGAQLSLSLGFGYGRRADMSDGHSHAGGFGLFADTGGGRDSCQCGIFGLGCAYWYALGILYDDGGNDEYRSDSYALASPAHFGIGIVIDDGGDDIWRGKSSRACGFGRDFSLGWFEDSAGNDIYLCNDAAYGAGNVNGLGVCWDKAGSDTWVARSNSFGQPFMESEKTVRDFPLNAGLFLDAAGTDRYLQLPEGTSTWDLHPQKLDHLPQHPVLQDHTRKSWRRHLPHPGSTGAAMDAP
jgi:hypothetical protein